MLSGFFLVLVLGKISMYTIDKFPLTIKIKNRSQFLDELFSCDFCLGVWTYTVLFWLTGVWFENLLFIPILSPLLIGTFASFLVHLISLGWRTKFEVIIIE